MKMLLAVVLAVIGTAVLFAHPANQMMGNSSSGNSGSSQTYYAAPRFQIATVQPGTAGQESVLLDTETGCTWRWAAFRSGNQEWDFHPFDNDATNPAGPSAQQQVACDQVLRQTIARHYTPAPSH